jgi:hypothetical protein
MFKILPIASLITIEQGYSGSQIFLFGHVTEQNKTSLNLLKWAQLFQSVILNLQVRDTD